MVPYASASAVGCGVVTINTRLADAAKLVTLLEMPAPQSRTVISTLRAA
jgi:hypothetical protein